MKQHIMELRSVKRPPPEYVDICAAVAFLIRGEQEKISWKACQKMLANPTQFLESLATFDTVDAEHIDDVTMEKLEPLVEQDFFSFAAMRGRSTGVALLAKWVSSVIAFNKSNKRSLIVLAKRKAEEDKTHLLGPVVEEESVEEESDVDSAFASDDYRSSDDDKPDVMKRRMQREWLRLKKEKELRKAEREAARVRRDEEKADEVAFKAKMAENRRSRTMPGESTDLTVETPPVENASFIRFRDFQEDNVSIGQQQSGYHERLAIHRQDCAATTIQSAFRGNQGRHIAMRKREEAAERGMPIGKLDSLKVLGNTVPSGSSSGSADGESCSRAASHGASSATNAARRTDSNRSEAPTIASGGSSIQGQQTRSQLAGEEPSEASCSRSRDGQRTASENEEQAGGRTDSKSETLAVSSVSSSRGAVGEFFSDILLQDASSATSAVGKSNSKIATAPTIASSSRSIGCQDNVSKYLNRRVTFQDMENEGAATKIQKNLRGRQTRLRLARGKAPKTFCNRSHDGQNMTPTFKTTSEIAEKQTQEEAKEGEEQEKEEEQRQSSKGLTTSKSPQKTITKLASGLFGKKGKVSASSANQERQEHELSVNEERRRTKAATKIQATARGKKKRDMLLEKMACGRDLMTVSTGESQAWVEKQPRKQILAQQVSSRMEPRLRDTEEEEVAASEAELSAAVTKIQSHVRAKQSRAEVSMKKRQMDEAKFDAPIATQIQAASTNPWVGAPCAAQVEEEDAVVATKSRVEISATTANGQDEVA